MFRTLLVEDSFLFRKSLKETLHSRFPWMEIIEATDGKEAFEKIDSFSPTLVFMDIELHGENGLKLTKKIKSKYPQTIIIVLTSHDLPEYREAANQHNADYFLSKGLSTREDILKLVDSILSDRQTITPKDPN